MLRVYIWSELAININAGFPWTWRLAIAATWFSFSSMQGENYYWSIERTEKGRTWFFRPERAWESHEREITPFRHILFQPIFITFHLKNNGKLMNSPKRTEKQFSIVIFPLLQCIAFRSLCPTFLKWKSFKCFHVHVCAVCVLFCLLLSFTYSSTTSTPTSPSFSIESRVCWCRSFRSPIQTDSQRHSIPCMLL